MSANYFLETTTISGIRCCRRGCTNVLRGPAMSYFQGHKYYERLAASQGWTFWVGRSRIAYCPEHTPGRSSKMWQDHKPAQEAAAAAAPGAADDPTGGA